MRITACAARFGPGRACRRPARASACSIVSQVRTPNAHGIAGVELDVLDPARGLVAHVVVVVVSPRITAPEACDPGEAARVGAPPGRERELEGARDLEGVDRGRR